jgi:superfamily II DNA or RNA helicase
VAIETRNFSLEAWQRAAVERWVAGDGARPFRGTLEIFTGGGKTLIALACAEAAGKIDRELRLAVVVPTKALVLQWIEAVIRFSNIQRPEIGVLGAGHSGDLSSSRVLVAVLNTAAARLPLIGSNVQSLMLVIDECHRAGAESFRRVLATPAKYTLGLSATPERDEFDDDGEPVKFDEQIVAQHLGKLIYSFGLKEARNIGWLPTYEIHHHGVPLGNSERQRYEDLSRQIDDVSKRVQSMGGETRLARRLASRTDELGRLARAYTALTAKRKDLLFRAASRRTIATALVRDAFRDNRSSRILLFHERVAQAQTLFDDLSRVLPPTELAVEHSKLPDPERRFSLDRFRSGDARVLVSVKSLVEGIDVPEADVGISVASSSSVRQRIQSLGRVLRRSFDPAAAIKRASMHVIYVADSVDELIYAKEDWSTITGSSNNHYWIWSGDDILERHSQTGPPREPKPSESTVWETLGNSIPAELPIEWPGVIVGQEYSVDTLGNVTNLTGRAIVNPQGVSKMVVLVRGRPGGRFRVTPEHRVVLIARVDEDSTKWYIGGRLETPFAVEDSTETEAATTQLGADPKPGESYSGPLNSTHGTFRLRQKGGGVIERHRSGGGAEWALAGDGVPAELRENARLVLDVWRSEIVRGIEFYVNDQWVAWYRTEGQARILATVPGGFAWPTPSPEQEG